MPASIRSNTTIQTDFTLPGAVLVTKRDVAASLDAYENLLRASKQFRLAMQAASRATCDFAGNNNFARLSLSEHFQSRC